MKTRAQCGITAGIAIVGTSVIALTPIAPPPTETFASPDAVAVNLMASPSPLEELAGGLGESGLNLAVGTVKAPLGLLVIAQALAEQNDRDLYLAIREYIDAPLYVADPTIFALDNVLDPPIGGDSDENPETAHGSAITAFRADVLWAATHATRAPFAAALGLEDNGDPISGAEVNVPVTLAVGLGGSTVRLVKDLALGVLGPVEVVGDVVGGTPFNKALYLAARDYIDAPLQIADPTFFALDDVLPTPLGGGEHDDLNNIHGSEILNFRNNLWTATKNTREPIAAALGVDPNSGNPLTSGSSEQLSVNEFKAPVQEKTGPSLAKKSGGPSLLGSNTKTVGLHRKQTDNPVRAVVKKFRESVKAAAPKPKPSVTP